MKNDTVFIRQITADGAMEAVNTYNMPIVPEGVIRGGVYIEKWDAELDENKAQGGGSLDVTVEIATSAKHPVLVGGKEYAPGEVVYTMTPTVRGAAPRRKPHITPYTHLRGAGNRCFGGLSCNGRFRNAIFTIRRHGEMVRLDTTDMALKNSPIRGDLRALKSRQRREPHGRYPV